MTFNVLLNKVYNGYCLGNISVLAKVLNMSASSYSGVIVVACAVRAAAGINLVGVTD